MISQTTLLPEESIIVITLADPVDHAHDPKRAANAFFELAAQRDGPHVRILDFTQMTPDLPLLLMALKRDAALRAEGVYHYFVGAHELVQLAAATAAQKQYGSLHIRVFATLAEAIADARALLSQRFH